MIIAMVLMVVKATVREGRLDAKRPSAVAEVPPNRGLQPTAPMIANAAAEDQCVKATKLQKARSK
jgi:hypothetical protein